MAQVREYFKPYRVNINPINVTGIGTITNLVNPSDTDRASFVMVADFTANGSPVTPDFGLTPTDDSNAEANNTDDTIMINTRNVLAQPGLTETNRINALSLMIAQNLAYSFGIRPVVATATSNAVSSENHDYNMALPDFTNRLYNRTDNFFSSLAMLNDRGNTVSTHSRLLTNLLAANTADVYLSGTGGNDVFTVRYESNGADSAVRIRIEPPVNSGASFTEYVIYDLVNPNARFRLSGGAGNDVFIFDSQFLARSSLYPFQGLSDKSVDVFGGTSADTIELRSSASMNVNYEQLGEEIRVQAANGNGASVFTRFGG